MKASDYAINHYESNRIYTSLENQSKSDKIVEKAKTERQRVLITESNGEANIDWDTRGLQDVKLLLEYGLDYVNKLEKQGGKKPADKVEPAWSEEDELKRSTLIHVVRKQKGSAIFEGLLPEELINWLNSIKQRIEG